MRQVVMFKHGVAYYGLEGVVVDADVLKLTFKLGELDDVLKSLTAADLSGQGYISAVTYDASEDETKLFESAAIRVSERNSFSGALSQLPGAEVELDIGGRVVSGLIVGLEVAVTRLGQNSVQTPSLVVFNREAGSIEKFTFTDLRGFKLQSEELGKELQFYLNAALSAKKKGSRTVSIACEGKGARDLAVSYVTESPIWKTSYRILLPKVSEESEGEAESEEPADSESNLKILLSGWCLVENTTDQDWDRVELSLVAGMPVSFKMPLFKPLYIERPHVQPARTTGATVMDIDDEVDRVSYNEATIAAPCLAPPCEPEERAKSEGLGYLGASASGAGMGAGDMARMFKMANADSFGVMEKQTVSKDAFRAQMAQATAVESKDFGETFEYEISDPVSIKRQQSALVPIVNADVEG
ncbi:MAG TPA: hypothetical protein VKK79_25600, partial [Candidatus Lokiarchaeia archaeon]|nr:hypothetical protein [Candidatus Lokiarchaeia archaeon]